MSPSQKEVTRDKSKKKKKMRGKKFNRPNHLALCFVCFVYDYLFSFQTPCINLEICVLYHESTIAYIGF